MAWKLTETKTMYNGTTTIEANTYKSSERLTTKTVADLLKIIEVDLPPAVKLYPDIWSVDPSKNVEVTRYPSIQFLDAFTAYASLSKEV